MTTNIRPGTPPPPPIIYLQASPVWHSTGTRYDYYLDPETKMDCGATTPEAAMAQAQLYMRDLTKWRESRGVGTMTYWPTTPGVFQLDDFNRLMIRDRRRYGTSAPATVFLVGRHEREQIAAIGPVSPAPHRCVKGVIAQTHELYRPFEFFGVMCYPVNVVSCAELLRT